MFYSSHLYILHSNISSFLIILFAVDALSKLIIKEICVCLSFRTYLTHMILLMFSFYIMSMFSVLSASNMIFSFFRSITLTLTLYINI